VVRVALIAARDTQRRSFAVPLAVAFQGDSVMRAFGSVAALCLSLAAPWPAAADVAVYANGTRAKVEQPAKDSKGQWMGTIDGRRQRLQPGEIVALVNDEGDETSLIPELQEGAVSPSIVAGLASLSDVKNDEWFGAVQQIASPPTRAAFDELLKLAASSKKELRIRAVHGLVALKTAESSLAAAQAVVDEKDAKARREAASALFSVREILRRSAAAELVLKGLADKDALVRFEFALVAPHDLELAAEVLRKDGLKSGDHHVRESAAVELGLRGDASGEATLVAMLMRSQMPGMEDDAELGRRFLIREQVEICAILGKLGTASGRAALEKAKSNSPHEAVRKAAAEALGG